MEPIKRLSRGQKDYVTVEVMESSLELINDLFALPGVADIMVTENEEKGLKVVKLYRDGDLDIAMLMVVCLKHTQVGEIEVHKETGGEKEDEEKTYWDPYGHEVEEKPIDMLEKGEHVPVKHHLSLRQRLQVVSSYITLRSKLWYRFKVSFLFSLISMFIAIMIWYFMGIILGSIDLGQDYRSVNYFTFVLVGIIINQYIIITITTYLETLKEIYWQNRLEIYMTSPARLNTFFASALVWTYLYATINVLIYFGVGIFLFGASLTIPSRLKIAAGNQQPDGIVIFTIRILMKVSMEFG